MNWTFREMFIMVFFGSLSFAAAILEHGFSSFGFGIILLVLIIMSFIYSIYGQKF